MSELIRIISDIHLGCPISKVDKVIEVLDLPCSKLIINGDLFDSFNLKRFNHNHWKVLSKIRKLSKKIPVIFIRGNHDGNIEFLSDLLGMEIFLNYEIFWNNKKIFITHGDGFDHYAQKKLLSDFFTGLYYFIQKIDGNERIISTWLKLQSKKILKVHRHLEERAIKYAKQHGYDICIVSHSHLEGYIMKDNIEYWNTGSFCEKDCTFIEISDKEITLKQI